MSQSIVESADVRRKTAAGQASVVQEVPLHASKVKEGASVVVNTAFMVRKLTRIVALGFGSGLSPIAPGTIGTFFAWISFDFMRLILKTDSSWALWLSIAFVYGVFACKRVAHDLKQSDPSCIVWDEILAFWLILWLLTPSGVDGHLLHAAFSTQVWAFILFRLFDAVKPGPVGWADQAFKGEGIKGAFGILWDDCVAALCTLLCIVWWRF